ncbi:MAG: matrixin family metalloprotease, partial [Halothece sp. Uz-M2-17]|nr:matrixin family metalloprotease [Halothece sp. Uz-M2-17]
MSLSQNQEQAAMGLENLLMSDQGGDPIKIDVDYSFDNNNFFDSALKKEALEETLHEVASHLGDDLDAIIPTGNNTWNMVFADPSTGNLMTLEDETIPADTLRVYVGGRDLLNIAQGGFGGFNVQGSEEFVNTVSTRGESSSTNDFAPWGGTISFDRDTNWYFGSDISGLGSNQTDFRSVAAHEFFHVLGFTDSNPSFNTLINPDNFTLTGPDVIAEYDHSGSPPLNGSGDLSHWQEGLTDEGQEVAMDPTLTTGTRKMPTDLDFAALDDLGWEVLEPAEVPNQIQSSPPFGS